MSSKLKFIFGIAIVICTFSASSYSAELTEGSKEIVISSSIEDRQDAYPHNLHKMIYSFWLVTQGNDKRNELGVGNLPDEVKVNLAYIMTDLFESYRQFTYPKWETIKDWSLWTKISENKYKFIDKNQGMVYSYSCESWEKDLQTPFKEI